MESLHLVQEKAYGPNIENSLKEQFIDLSEQMVELLSSAEVDLLPYLDAQLPWFSMLPASQKQMALAKISQLIKIYQMTLAQGGELRNSKMLLWTALKEFGYKFKSDLLDLIEDGDIVEVYDTDHRQIFCNMNFYDYCSYTAEDIFCRPWHELFKREINFVTHEIIATAGKLKLGEIHGTQRMDYLGAQRVEEVDSAFKYQYDLNLKYLSPLQEKEQTVVTAFVAIESAQILNESFVKDNQSQLLQEFYSKDI